MATTYESGATQHDHAEDYNRTQHVTVGVNNVDGPSKRLNRPQTGDMGWIERKRTVTVSYDDGEQEETVYFWDAVMENDSRRRIVGLNPIEGATQRGEATLYLEPVPEDDEQRRRVKKAVDEFSDGDWDVGFFPGV